MCQEYRHLRLGLLRADSTAASGTAGALVAISMEPPDNIPLFLLCHPFPSLLPFSISIPSLPLLPASCPSLKHRLTSRVPLKHHLHLENTACSKYYQFDFKVQDVEPVSQVPQ